MKRAMLEVIATGSASTEEDLKLYASCTLLALLNDVPDAAIQACVAWLVSNEFIRRQIVDEGKERLTPTQLGLACLASSLSPDESLVLLNELKTAMRRGLILDSDLHLVYQVVSQNNNYNFLLTKLNFLLCLDYSDICVRPDD
jgi:DNA polymerase theta